MDCLPRAGFHRPHRWNASPFETQTQFDEGNDNKTKP